jgi:hypothetical protein
MTAGMRALGAVALLCVALGSAHASFIDYDKHEITIKIVYYGATGTTAADENLAYIYAKTAVDKRGTATVTPDHGGSSTFLPLTLGKIRGFTTQVHLYTVATAKQYVAQRAVILKGADGIVFIADAAPASAKANVASLAELKQLLIDQGSDYDKLPIVFQYVGTTKKGALSVAELEKSLGVGEHPGYQAVPPKGVGVFDTLKAIAKLVLMELRDAASKP